MINKNLSSFGKSDTSRKSKIKKGDIVKVIMGKDKGKTGKVEKVLLKKRKLVVEGVNFCKKHLKPQGEKNPGGIIDVVKPLPISKVVLVCPHCKKTTRVKFKITNSSKERICRRCQAGL